MGDPFLAYDIRGRIGEDLDEDTARDIGLAFCHLFEPGRVVVGRDVRLSSEAIASSLSLGLMEGGADVIDIGLCGTETVYFATPYLDADGGFMVTASHNPANYNGMKIVRRDSVPVYGNNGLHAMGDLVKKGGLKGGGREGGLREVDVTDEYIRTLLSFLTDRPLLEGFSLVTDAGNGCAGPVMDRLEEELLLDAVKLHNDPDGRFPNGVPNPLLPEMRTACSSEMRKGGHVMGIAWDGDHDRCFFFDEKGGFIDGYYIVGLLAKSMLSASPGDKIIHDPRLTWNTIRIVKEKGGTPIMNRTGHAFIKERMRREDAIYGGEMSAHHYFRDFHYCDTGMVPWLLVLEMIGRDKRTLSDMVRGMAEDFPVSGEINRRVEDQIGVMEGIEERYRKGALSVDRTDGISIEHEYFRFNLRASNTEPLLRLNVETRGDRELLGKKTSEILSLIDSLA